MDLSYFRLDDRVDAVFDAEFSAPLAVRRSFRERFDLSWIYHELQLEGVPLSESDLRRATSGVSGRDFCDGQLMEAIRRVQQTIDQVRTYAYRRTPIKSRLLHHLHALFTGDDKPCVYREDDRATEAYKHDVVPADEISDQLGRLIDRTNRLFERIHPIELATEVHFRFVKIWPFEEGSAAVARMLMNTLLISQGYPPLVIHASDRRNYYHSLHYDITRSQSLLLDAMEEQIAFRERYFNVRPLVRSVVA